MVLGWKVRFMVRYLEGRLRAGMAPGFKRPAIVEKAAGQVNFQPAFSLERFYRVLHGVVILTCVLVGKDSSWAPELGREKGLRS